MSLLDETRQWVDSEGPDADEVRQTIDNLSHQYGVAEPGRRTELFNSISFLCGLLSIEPGEVVLPEVEVLKVGCALDLAPLGGTYVEGGGQPLCGQKKAAVFEALKESLRRPF